MERQPKLVDDNPLVREIQEIEASRHEKIDTFEQARLDAIARLMMADEKSFQTVDQRERISKVQAKQIESIKQRQPEFVTDDENVKTLQQIEAAKHGKINTFEQERLNMMARLAMNTSESLKAQRAADIQKKSILGKSGDVIDLNVGGKGTKSREERELTAINTGTDNSAMYGFNYSNDTRDDLPFESTDNRLKKLKQDMNNMHDTYMTQLKDVEDKYKSKIDNLLKKIESDKVLLRTKDEMIQTLKKDHAKTIKYLEKSKYSLIKSTSKEIDSLRRQIKMYNQGKIN